MIQTHNYIVIEAMILYKKNHFNQESCILYIKNHFNQESCIVEWKQVWYHIKKLF